MTGSWFPLAGSTWCSQHLWKEIGLSLVCSVASRVGLCPPRGLRFITLTVWNLLLEEESSTCREMLQLFAKHLNLTSSNFFSRFSGPCEVGGHLIVMAWWFLRIKLLSLKPAGQNPWNPQSTLNYNGKILKCVFPVVLKVFSTAVNKL